VGAGKDTREVADGGLREGDERRDSQTSIRLVSRATIELGISKASQAAFGNGIADDPNNSADAICRAENPTENPAPCMSQLLVRPTWVGRVCPQPAGVRGQTSGAVRTHAPYPQPTIVDAPNPAWWRSQCWQGHDPHLLRPATEQAKTSAGTGRQVRRSDIFTSLRATAPGTAGNSGPHEFPSAIGLATLHGRQVQFVERQPGRYWCGLFTENRVFRYVVEKSSLTTTACGGRSLC